MSLTNSKYRFLFAGGGTGGHLFPAIAVAEEIRTLEPESDILFIGAKTKIEGKVVPQSGFKFKSIWIKGFSRKLTFDNLLFPVRLIVSVIQSILINMKFRPRVAIGSGGYVSGPAVYASSILGAKIILLEQNSYPGITTRLLEKYADEIHISFENSIKYFRSPDKVILSGNPIRKTLQRMDRANALREFGLSENKKTLLVLGGSLGAASINEAVASFTRDLSENNIQLLWQTGKNYFEFYKEYEKKDIRVNKFIDNMQAAYSACDLLISRAGATTIAEVLSLGVAAVFVPSPNVAENHQFQNAKSLADVGAAVLIEDKNLKSELIDVVLTLINNQEKLEELSKNARALAKPDAAHIIAMRAINYAKAV